MAAAGPLSNVVHVQPALRHTSSGYSGVAEAFELEGSDAPKIILNCNFCSLTLEEKLIEVTVE